MKIQQFVLPCQSEECVNHFHSICFVDNCNESAKWSLDRLPVCLKHYKQYAMTNWNPNLKKRW